MVKITPSDVVRLSETVDAGAGGVVEVVLELVELEEDEELVVDVVVVTSAGGEETGGVVVDPGADEEEEEVVPVIGSLTPGIARLYKFKLPRLKSGAGVGLGTAAAKGSRKRRPRVPPGLTNMEVKNKIKWTRATSSIF